MWDTSQLVGKWPRYTKRNVAAVLALLSLCVSLNYLLFWQTASLRSPLRDDDEADPSTTHQLCARRGQRYSFGRHVHRHRCRDRPEQACVAVVVTINMGFYDFFVNWFQHYEKSNDDSLLVVIAEDSQVYHKLTSDDLLAHRNIEIVLGDGSEAQSTAAEGFGTEGYRVLVSGRATHLLNVLCGLEQANHNRPSMLDRLMWTQHDTTTATTEHKWIVIYTDIDELWLQNPIPIILSAL
jgi:hypothetical protein